MIRAGEGTIVGIRFPVSPDLGASDDTTSRSSTIIMEGLTEASQNNYNATGEANVPQSVVESPEFLFPNHPFFCIACSAIIRGAAAVHATETISVIPAPSCSDFFVLLF